MRGFGDIYSQKGDLGKEEGGGASAGLNRGKELSLSHKLKFSNP